MKCMARNAIDNVLKKHSPDAVRAGCIRWWLSDHPKAVSHLTADGKTQEFLDATPPSHRTSVEQRLAGTCVKPTLKHVEAAFERTIDAHRRKKQGAIYTPNHIIDYLITEACRPQQDQENFMFLDPACGSGGFLVRGAAQLSCRFGIPVGQALMENIAGVDNDPEALEHARCLIELFAADEGEGVNSRDVRLLCVDTLLSPPERLLRMIAAPNGVQVLATNPPYVKLQTLDSAYRSQLASRYSGFTQFNFSLAPLFVIAGRRLLAPDGTLAYITQNNLFTSFAGEQVRRALQDDRCIGRIVDFGHHRVFKGVLAYTCLLFVDNERHDSIAFERIEREVGLRDLQELDLGAVPVDSLNPKKWRLAKPVHLRNLRRIEKTLTPLGKVATIRVGFATLKDKVFFVDKGEPYCRAYHPGTRDEYQVEASLTHPAVRVADIREEDQMDSVTRRIIFPYRRVKGRYIAVPEADLRSDFPKAYRYLSACRDILESRDKGKRSYEAWYAWGRTQARDAPGPKLLTKTFNTRPQFFMDYTDRLFCNGYAIFPARSGLFGSAPALEVLKVILQSRVMHYYAKLTSFQIHGNYQCYQKNFIEKFGIPELTDANQEDLMGASRDERDEIVAGLFGISPRHLDDMVGPVKPHDAPHTPQRDRCRTHGG